MSGVESMDESKPFQPPWLHKMYNEFENTSHRVPGKTYEWIAEWTDGPRQFKVRRYRSDRPRCDATMIAPENAWGESFSGVCGLLPRHDGPHVSVHSHAFGRLVADIQMIKACVS